MAHRRFGLARPFLLMGVRVGRQVGQVVVVEFPSRQYKVPMRLRYQQAGETFLQIETADSVQYNLSGEESPGAHRLVFRFYFNTWSGARILDGHLLLSGQNGVPKIGTALLEADSRACEHGGKLEFALLLDARRLERLCDLRASGGKMHLRATIVLLVTGSGDVQRLEDSQQLDFPASDWFAAISSAGFGDSIVNEFTIKRDDVQPNLASAMGALRDALRAFRETSGHDARARDAVAACRLAFEGGVLDAKRHTLLPEATRAKTMTKEERLQTLRWATQLVGHLAHHDPKVDWSMRDARLMCSVTAALLEWESGKD